MSDDNQRQSFRTDFHAQAELFHRGAVVPCEIVNLSAGGMRLTSLALLEPGEPVSLGLRLFGDVREAAGLDYLNFHLEVLGVDEVERDDAGAVVREYRCRNLTPEGSPLYERAHRIVFDAERRRLAAVSGMDEASPMQRDHERDLARRVEAVPRYGKSSLNPLLKD
jgi:hypothetical protein